MVQNFSIIFDPDGFIPPSSAHADRGVIQNRAYMAFDVSTVEAMRSKSIRMPQAYTGSGLLKAAIQYAMASATTGKVDFEISVEAITPLDAVDTDSTESFDSINAGNQTVPGTAGYIGELIITLTNKDSVAAGDYFRFKIERDADDGTDDTASGDCRVYSVTIYEEV